MATAIGMMMGTSSSATVAVDKATSDLLIGPDWTINMDICDSLNTQRWQAKDVVKAIKKRLQHKSPKVQLLALTLLETMVKNCGEYVHFQIAEKNILGEMTKTVRKKTDKHVRDKILVLLDSWQEAFGGPGGKHPQYYWAYEELRRSGVEFPPRSLDTAPIFTPPASSSTLMLTQTGYGMPSNSTRRLDETMAAEVEGLSSSSLESIQNVVDLLSDMLQAVNPGDREAIKDEVIVDLVEHCQLNQKKLMQMLTATGEEALLVRGLELNESLQDLLAKYEGIASGCPLATQVGSSRPKPAEGSSSDIKQVEVRDHSPSAKSTSPAANVEKDPTDDGEEEDDFAQLARRHSKVPTSPSQTSNGTCVDLVPVNSSPSTTSSSTTAACNALALPDPPPPVKTSKNQDMVDFLSMALTITTPSSSDAALTPPASDQNIPQNPSSSSAEDYANTPHTFQGNQGQQPYNGYVAPWAYPQQQYQSQALPPAQFQPQAENQMQVQSQAQHRRHFQQHAQAQPQLQPLLQPQFQSYPQQSTTYPPPPWATTPGYYTGQTMFSSPRASYTSTQASRPMQQYNSFPGSGNTAATVNGDSAVSSSRNSAILEGQKPFVPSYRLFEDLNVFGNADGRYNMNNSASPMLAGNTSQGMMLRGQR